ncbi:galactosyl-1-phosphate transferase [Candidatus Beckwithbacteria bacterium CG23_combo_of_CG06-09_8_20_14_all_34_8]|uniref:Galactosyl-1-phosphate transferase n=1 Tax=Candidatus Beckwithbacteria bacterium CG23_combo_of_CG06-09_8_20_14_all_34_8 TaxID=1974497 RepID=A0A2H0B6R8_9BACT|nr:MAG: galactosyl-1-phosphate transferase [Candidatus Beckwithbacteria bacterium CG23_combo_of_CG06-09_8_20_14_all_34_8]
MDLTNISNNMSIIYNLMRSDLAKRILDIFAAIILFIIFAPVWIIIPILIKLDSPGSVFYRHKRMGKGGKEFWLFKFRTMVEDADEILHKKDPELLKKFKENDWKLENDPRITPLGKMVRNLTLDEFPQLWNVLKGDMSLVGPRAYLKKELDEQTRKYPQTKSYVEEILKIKPGVTGPWQTSGRNVVPFVVRAKMDAEYARTHNVIRDIVIMLKTPKAMVSKW